MKIGVVSLGCPKNTVDSEIMLGILKNQKFDIVNDQKQADVIIINTCGFIESAKQESIDTILEMAECKKDKCKLIIVTGCLAQRYKHDILDAIPEVDAVLGTGSYSEIANVIKDSLQGLKPELYGKLEGTQYLETERILSSGKSYAYLKIAEGCDNFCTYCVIPSLRGRYRSRKIEDVINEANKLISDGIKEIILVAQDTTRYGSDIYNEKKLYELLQKISEIKGDFRIRLLYCYPDEIDDKLIAEIATNPKICKYLDIPIQHASDKVLENMGRRGNSKQIGKILDELRFKIPGVILRTSLIVGFPGETEEDFDILEKFVVQYRFDRLGVFMYSKEEGTPAAKMKQQISKAIKKKRQDTIMALQQKISSEKSNNRIGSTVQVIVEGISDDGIFYFGRSYAEAPDIDGLIYFTSKEQLEINETLKVRILTEQEYDLIGEVENEST